jgi:hypothetical protein
MSTPKEPEEQVEEKVTDDDMPDMNVSGQDAESVKGGMAKPRS